MGLPMTSPSKPAFTAGPARVVRDHPSNACAYVKGATGCELATLYGGALDLPDQASRIAARDANAELIAESFTVAHETGLTPRQLAGRCEKLEAALRELQPALLADHGCKGGLSETTRKRAYAIVSAALSKATAGGAV